MYVGIFCGPRASEVLGLQWKSWTGTTLVPHGTAFEGQFYNGRFKTSSKQGAHRVPEQVRPIIEAWQRGLSPTPSPEALMFPTFGRGERKGRRCRAGERTSSNGGFVRSPREAGIPDRPHHVSGDAADAGNGHAAARHAQGCARGMLRHASIKTTGDVYVQTIESSVLNAMNSRTNADPHRLETHHS
jgi:integrase